MIPRVRVTRYVTPLREGGSLPGIVEAEDLGHYVCKFRGAGQGTRVLVAEVVVSAIAARLGLRTPRLVALDLCADIARYEADEEVQDLLTASLGLNLGVDFLPGAFGLDGDFPGGAEEAATVLWLDAFCANVDRSWRNPNLLVWHGEAWVIDHGASLYFHHAWSTGLTDPARFAVQPWSVADHVLERFATGLPDADTRVRPLLDRDFFVEVLGSVPDEWLDSTPALTPAELRVGYVDFLTARLASRAWLPQVTA